MAHYIGLSLNDLPNSELRVANALKSLDDHWTVIHNVTWQSVRAGREGDGEADFLLLHPKYGMIVIEVKGGGISMAQGRWTTENRHGEIIPIKNPFDQARDSKYALSEYIKGRLGQFSLQYGHAACFPDMMTMPALGPAAREEIAWLRGDLHDVGPAVGRIIQHWQMKAALGPNEIAAIVQLLAPTLRVSVPTALRSADAERRILELTAEQIEAFNGLRAARGGSVTGLAGSGKTLLAVARARQLIDDGFRTLLLCYNELLGHQLSDRLSPIAGSFAGTFHSLCIGEAKKARAAFPPELSSDWWENEAPQVLISSAAKNGTEFDAVVIDEAQDFAPSWLEALRCILRPGTDAPFFTFADPNQDLWNRDWRSAQSGEFTYHLTKNLRNTQPIAERAAAAIELPAAKFGAEGPPPVWRMSNERKNRFRDAVAAIERMVEEGFTPANLVVLCESAQLAGRLRDETVGPYSLGNWNGRGIPVETLARFKGMEAEAAVVVLEDNPERSGRLMGYVGLSRPRSALTVVGPPARKSQLNWL